MLVVYVYFDNEDRVIIVTIQDARSSHAVRLGLTEKAGAGRDLRLRESAPVVAQTNSNSFIGFEIELQQIRVPAALDKKIRRLAQKRGISQSALIVGAVEALLDAFHRSHQRRTAQAFGVCRRHLPLTLRSDASYSALIRIDGGSDK